MTRIEEMRQIEEHAERARALVAPEHVVAEQLAHLRITRDQLLADLVSSQVPNPAHGGYRGRGEAAVAAMVSKHTAKAVDRQVVHRATGRAQRREWSETICPEHLEASLRLAAQLVSLVRAVDRRHKALLGQLVYEVHAVLDGLEATKPTGSYTYHDPFYQSVVKLLDWWKPAEQSEATNNDEQSEATNNDEQSRATNNKVPKPKARARVLQLRRRVRQIERRRARSRATSSRT